MQLNLSIPLETADGLILAPPSAIASWTHEWGGRWRAVLNDGTVAHGPEPKSLSDWQPLGAYWVRPESLRMSESGWIDPAAFVVGPAVVLNPSPPRAPSDALPDLPCSLEEVVCLEAGSGFYIWHTQTEQFSQSGRASRVASQYPELVLMRRGLYVNQLRVIRIQPDRPGRRFLVIGESGKVLAQVQEHNHEIVSRRFGLPQFFWLEPRNEAFSRWQLRDWPISLISAKADFLRAHFFTAECLIMNVLWQVVRYRKQGVELELAGDYRGFFYDALYATLYRAGFLTRAKSQRGMLRSRQATENQLYPLYQKLVGQAVGEDRLFTFRELGFADPNGERLHLGDRHPEVVVVAEKTCLDSNLAVLREKFGVTTFVTAGQPKLLSTEYLIEALRSRIDGTIRIIAYVDFDPAGWIIAKAFARMVERYSVLVREIVYLVRAKHFTADELELFAVPLPNAPTINRKWLEESGGLEGREEGIHCSHLRPLARVLSAFEEVF